MLRLKNSRTSLVSLILAVPLGFFACGGDEKGDPSGTGGGASTGGANNTGGSTNNTGGSTNSGGSSTGGQNVSSGGTASGGGNLGTGGESPAGGSGTGTGGAGAGGGDPGSGGSATGGSSGGGIVPGTSSYNCDPPEGTFTAADLDVEEVVTGLSVPIFVTHAPNDDRLFVVEQDGVIKVVENGAVTGTFLDINTKVTSPMDAQGFSSESGLLGLAFHPNYAENGLFYVDYTAAQPLGQTIIAEYKVTDDPNVADPDSERVLISQMQPDRNHNGGMLTIGPDGNLYIAFGDGGPILGYDPNNHGQNPGTLLATISRIDPTPSGSEPYTIPAGNLKDEMASAAPEVWSYGLRNPFRFNFDACNADLYIGDVGQGDKEELDIVKDGEGHKNFGWSIMEGSICTPAGNGKPVQDCSDKSGFVLPVYDYDTMTGAAIIGGSVYRGSGIPALRGTYFFTDNGSGRLRYTQYDRDAGTISAPVDLTNSVGSLARPAAIQTGNDGELYIAEAGSGSILKIIPKSQ